MTSKLEEALAQLLLSRQALAGLAESDSSDEEVSGVPGPVFDKERSSRKLRFRGTQKVKCLDGPNALLIPISGSVFEQTFTFKGNDKFFVGVVSSPFCHLDEFDDDAMPSNFLASRPTASAASVTRFEVPRRQYSFALKVSVKTDAKTMTVQADDLPPVDVRYICGKPTHVCFYLYDGSSLTVGAPKASPVEVSSHALVGYSAAAKRCLRCSMYGPSQQTGIQECSKCELCAACCGRDTACAGPMQPSPPPPGGGSGSSISEAALSDVAGAPTFNRERSSKRLDYMGTQCVRCNGGPSAAVITIPSSPSVFKQTFTLKGNDKFFVGVVGSDFVLTDVCDREQAQASFMVSHTTHFSGEICRFRVPSHMTTFTIDVTVDRDENHMSIECEGQPKGEMYYFCPNVSYLCFYLHNDTVLSVGSHPQASSSSPPPSAEGTGHSLRLYSLCEGFQGCHKCGMLGPSQQTGMEHCSGCQLCSKCCEKNRVCPAKASSGCDHDWEIGECKVCTQCGSCSGYGARCINHGAGRTRGKNCGCGGGDSGCSKCGMCRSCAGLEVRDAFDALKSLNSDVLRSIVRGLDEEESAEQDMSAGGFVLPVGSKVVRGPDWKWDDQDGGEGTIGVVTGYRGKWVGVRWPGGHHNFYRNSNEAIDIFPAEEEKPQEAPPAPAPVQPSTSPSSSAKNPSPPPRAESATPPPATTSPTTTTTTDDSALCVICSENPKNIVCVPCGHMLVCEQCSESMKAKSMACPMCRCAVQLWLKVFM